MRPRFRELCLAVACATALTGTAAAGPAAGDDKAAAAPAGGEPAGGEPAPSAAAAPAPEKAEKQEAELGVGIRFRNVRVPKALLQLVVERAPGGISNLGFGLDLVRRKGGTELQLGFEYEHIQPTEGVWIQSNTDVANGDEADYIVSPKNNGGTSLGWFSIEFTFLHHAEINEKLAFRYGAGLGLGIVTGNLGRYNIICAPGTTNADPDTGCKPIRFGGTGIPSPDGGDAVVQYKKPPVFPVVNAILGFQIRPVPKATINLEAGIRTFPFFGVSGGYFF